MLHYSLILSNGQHRPEQKTILVNIKTLTLSHIPLQQTLILSYSQYQQLDARPMTVINFPFFY
jgi:hypothetical protein